MVLPNVLSNCHRNVTLLFHSFGRLSMFTCSQQNISAIKNLGQNSANDLTYIYTLAKVYYRVGSLLPECLA